MTLKVQTHKYFLFKNVFRPQKDPQNMPKKIPKKTLKNNFENCAELPPSSADWISFVAPAFYALSSAPPPIFWSFLIRRDHGKIAESRDMGP